MEYFCIIANVGKDTNNALSNQIAEYVHQYGKKCDILPNVKYGEGECVKFTDASYINEAVECAIVLGGDGTIIQAASDLAYRNIPILGVNLGTLGFLAEIEKNEIFDALDCLFTGNYHIEDRMMIHGDIICGGVRRAAGHTLNDVVITRSGYSRIITTQIYINDCFVDSYLGDGVILATPTGSTGYSLSAGGPIVSPKMQAQVITPICPHTLNSRSIIVTAEDKISIVVGVSKKSLLEEAIVTFDGRAGIKLTTGDRIEIKRAAEVTKLVKLKKTEFFGRLQNKLQITK